MIKYAEGKQDVETGQSLANKTRVLVGNASLFLALVVTQSFVS
jgi:hypothetical protein